VAALQRRLTDLGYWLGTPDGEFGFLTQQAVFALQGAAGLQRDGVVGPRTRQALADGTRPQPRSSSGSVIEIDRDAGLLVFVDEGRPSLTLHTSTGTFEEYTHDGRTLLADTPEGTWEVSWSHDGWRDGALGRLYRPRYFHSDGIAVHGYQIVPAYPASHGCARVSLEAMDMIWAKGLMPRGATVLVH
jgi:N-acetylmuramoyl-L-alanine amidase